MSSASIRVRTSDAATAQKVVDAFAQDPTKFTQDAASNPQALGLSGDAYAYDADIDGKKYSGHVTADVTASGAVHVDACVHDHAGHHHHRHDASLDGFDAQPVVQGGSDGTDATDKQDTTNKQDTTDQQDSTDDQGNSDTQNAADTQGAKSSASATTDSALYPSGTPTVADVNQGQINDCSLDACLASLAQNNPSVITNMISPDAAGGYDVTLYPNGEKQSVHVTQSDIDAIKGATSAAGTSDWASVIEAATIKAGTDYTSGSDPGVIMGLLTNTSGTDQGIASLNGSTSTLQSALSAGNIVTATASIASGDIVPGHCYSVLSATADTVTVRNPWGDSASNDGIETMSKAAFLAAFDGIQMQS